MRHQLLTDLDSLILQVRSSQSKEYISEALNSFRAGSNRAAILLTWVALSYDLISKIRELSIDDNGAPKMLIDTFDKASKNQNAQKLLQIEREILTTAKELEIINNHEFYALERLREDRHKCAHPSHESEDYLFIPSPEQVCTHLVHALNFVLIQKPTQGKKAVERLISDIQNTTYIDEYDEFKKFIQSRFLNRAKASFITNAIKLLTKATILQTVPELTNHEVKTIHALKIFYDSNYYEAREIIKANINGLLDTRTPSTFNNLPKLISIDNKIWDYLTHDNQIAFTGLLQAVGSELIRSPYIYGCLQAVGIKTALETRLSSIDDNELLRIINDNSIKYFKDIIIQKFCVDPNYSKTKDFGYKLSGSYAKYLTISDLKKILTSSKNEAQIYGYYYFSKIMKELFSATKDRLLEHTKDNWIDLVQSNTSLGELKTILTQEGIIQETPAV